MSSSTSTPQKSALILLAEGTEEIEFVTLYDLLVRAGVRVVSASVSASSSTSTASSEAEGVVKCSRGVRILPDTTLSSLSLEQSQSFSILLIPGGLPGATTLASSPQGQALIAHYHARPATHWVGAICAGPLALLEPGSGLVGGGEKHEMERREEWIKGRGQKRLTSHPSVKEKLEGAFTYMEEPVVIDGNLITSRGPGTSILFALAIIKSLLGPEKEREVRGPLMIPE